MGQGIEKPDFKQIATDILREEESADPFQHRAGLANTFYWASIDFRSQPSFKLATVEIATPWLTTYRPYRNDEPKSEETNPVENLEIILSECAERASSVNGRITTDVEEIPVVPVSRLSKALEKSDNAKFRSATAVAHLHTMLDLYLLQHRVDEAVFHGNLAYRYDPRPGPSDANNLGYLYLVTGNLEQASELFEFSSKNYRDHDLRGLPYYNLGLLRLKQGRYDDASKLFLTASELANSRPKEALDVECLLVPRLTPNSKELDFEELSDPNLLDCLQIVTDVLSKLAQAAQ
jgi:tetratricopeptide (TPR) repeat protein